MKLEPFGDVGVNGKMSQCRMEYTQILDAAGNIPSFVVNGLVPSSLGLVEEVRNAFNRDKEVDQTDLSRLIKILKNSSSEEYTTGELVAISSVQALAEAADSKLENIESPSAFVTMRQGFIEGDPNNIGCGEVILDATLEECVAPEFMTYSRERAADFYENAGGVLRNIYKVDDNNDNIVRVG